MELTAKTVLLIPADFEVKKVNTAIIQKVRIKISLFTLKNSTSILKLKIPFLEIKSKRFLYFIAYLSESFKKTGYLNVN